MPVLLAAPVAEIRKITVGIQPRQDPILKMPPLKNVDGVIKVRP
jgi:hypothetical protein